MFEIFLLWSEFMALCVTGFFLVHNDGSTTEKGLMTNVESINVVKGFCALKWLLSFHCNCAKVED